MKRPKHGATRHVFFDATPDTLAFSVRGKPDHWTPETVAAFQELARAGIAAWERGEIGGKRI